MTICQGAEYFGERKSMNSHDYVAHVRILRVKEKTQC